jgi:hypothetical protein
VAAAEKAALAAERVTQRVEELLAQKPQQQQPRVHIRGGQQVL